MMSKIFRNFIGLVLIVFGIWHISLAQTGSDNKFDADLLEVNKPVERELKAQETHQYALQLKEGDFFRAVVDQRGIDVIVRVFALDGNKLAENDSLNGSNEIESVELEVKAPGVYKIEVSALTQDSKPGRYEIRIAEILSAIQYAKVLAEKEAKQQKFIKWLSDNTIPLKTVEAGNGFKDLQSLKKTLKDVQIIGLGESTHGTREFFQVKHRMLEFLVKEMDFRVFAMELDYVACHKINDYVTGKTDKYHHGLLKLWNTEEVLAMINWMRTYNASIPENKKVKFIGFDGQDRMSERQRFLDYIKRVAPERFPSIEVLFKDPNSGITPEKDKERKLQNKYVELFMFLELNGMSLINKSTKAEYEQMREIARAFVQPGYIYNQDTDQRTGYTLRDSYMAENFRRIVDREPVGTKFVIWAHNGHLETTTDFFIRMGYYLHRFYTNKYYSLSLNFYQGSFQAWDQEPMSKGKLVMKSFTVSPAVKESFDWYLSKARNGNFIIDFRAKANNQSISEWLTTSHLMRGFGATYKNGEDEKKSYYARVPGETFDGVIFINTTTRAKPSELMKKYAKIED